jgi:hypothetical protein
MKDFEVCRLVQGKWAFENKVTAFSRKELMSLLRQSADWRLGCVRVRLLK